MILFLTKSSIHHLCRLFSGRSIGCAYWCNCNKKDMIKVMFKRASLALEAVALEIANHGESITLGLVRSFSLCSFPRLANRPELISFI